MPRASLVRKTGHVPEEETKVQIFPGPRPHAAGGQRCTLSPHSSVGDQGTTIHQEQPVSHPVWKQGSSPPPTPATELLKPTQGGTGCQAQTQTAKQHTQRAFRPRLAGASTHPRAAPRRYAQQRAPRFGIVSAALFLGPDGKAAG